MRKITLSLAGSAILAFGLFNVHSLSGVTEGGVLGLTLLLNHWFSISPALSNLVLTVVCYLVGWRVLGKEFLLWSAVSCGGFSVFYALCEWIGPLFPQIAAYPLAAALVGALFVGVGVGLCVRAGGAPGGDDALAMALSKACHVRIETVYLISDLAVLALSLSYIPLSRILYSLATVLLSGKLVGLIARK